MTGAPATVRRDDTERATRATFALSWRVSTLTRRLLTLVALAAAAAVLTVDPAPLALAAPALVALSLWVRGPRPPAVDVTAEAERPRTFEGEAVPIRVAALTVEGSAGGYRLRLCPGDHVEVAGDPVGVTLDGRAELTWQVRSDLWGWWSVGLVDVEVLSPHRAWVGEVGVSAPALTVFPPVSSVRDVPPPPHLMARLGPHVSRAAGAGIEFAGIRPYQPGDPVRRVNWVRSAGRDALLVNQHGQERMGDVVVMIDAIRDVGWPGRTSVDESVRGAVGVVQAYLAAADRVGVVAFGSALRWLTPTTGVRHFYRIVEVLLRARQARTYVDPDLDRLPRAVLPSGALVICFSPLLDEVVIEAIRDLRERAHPVVVVDVLSLEGLQTSGRVDELTLRIWRLERQATVSSLQAIGAPVVSYADIRGGSLEWLRTTRPTGSVAGAQR